MLEKSDPSLKYFSVNIIDRTWNNDGSTTECLLGSVEVWDVNYFCLPKKFRNPLLNHQILLDIHGKDANGSIIYDSPYISYLHGGDIESTTWYCNSCGYSYTIVQAFHPTGDIVGYSISLSTGPGYVWWGNAEFPYTGSWYSIPGYIDQISALYFNANSIAEYDLSNCNEHRTASCGCVGSGNNVYAIGYNKGMREWLPYQGELVFGHSASDLQEAIALINSHAVNGIPFLFCSEMIELEWNPDEDAETNEEWTNFMFEILLNGTNGLIEEPFQIGKIGLNYDFWDMTSFVLSGYGTPADQAAPAISRIQNIRISPMDMASALPVLEFTSADLIAAQSDPTGLNFTLPEGLYACTLSIEGKGHRRIIFEVMNSTSNNFDLADLANIVIFPVPLSVNDYSFHFSTICKQEMKYELFDSNGNKLFMSDYIVESGHSEDHRISVSNGIPQGLLMNKFTFLDGSVKSITTLKISN